MIITDEFRLDHNKREKLTSLSEEFPYVCLDVTLDRVIGRSWHWHDAFELDYVTEGELLLTTPRQTYRLSAGDILFINSRILHDARSARKSSECRLYAQLFYPVFLSGMYGSRIEQKYIRPVLQCPDLDVWIFRAVREEDGASAVIGEILEVNREDLYGSELEIRAMLGKFWGILLEATKSFRQEKGSDEKKSPDTERLRKMIEFVRNHYMDDIHVSDIADSANISIRECNRCFQKNVGTPPNTFLNEYRLRIAANMLQETNESVISISADCGFTSQSYFGKQFRNKFECSPLEFRKKKQTPAH